MTLRTIFQGFAICLLFVLSACAGTGPILEKNFPMDESRGCRVAVLPMGNESDSRNGGGIATVILRSELSRLEAIQLVNDGDLSTFYRQLKIMPGQYPSQEQLRVMAETLGVDLFVGGAVFEFADKDRGKRTEASFALILQIIDPVQGNIAWSTYHRRTGGDYRKVMHFGVINTVTELARETIREIIDLWVEEGFTECAG